MDINKPLAREIVRAEASAVAQGGSVDATWVDKIQHLSQLCLRQAQTHIVVVN